MAGERRKGVAHAASLVMADHIPSVCCRDKGIVFRCFPGCHADIMHIGVAQLGLIFGLLEENEHLQRGAEFVRVTVALHKQADATHSLDACHYRASQQHLASVA
jgi:hypothetical protein